MTKKKKKIIILIVSILLGGALLYSGAWLYYYYAVCLPHMPAESYGFAIDEYLPQSSGGTYYTADIGDKYWFGCYYVPHFGNFHCSFTITTSTGIDDDHCIINEDGSVDYIPCWGIRRIVTLRRRSCTSNAAVRSRRKSPMWGKSRS